MKRTLSLKCEALGVLDEAELGAVVGGDYSGNGLTCGCIEIASLHQCLNTQLTCLCLAPPR